MMGAAALPGESGASSGGAKKENDNGSGQVDECVIDVKRPDSKMSSGAASDCVVVDIKTSAQPANKTPSTGWKPQKPSPMLQTENGDMFSPLTCVATRKQILKFLVWVKPPVEKVKAVLTLLQWKGNGVGNAMWLLLIPYGFSQVPAQFMKNGGNRALALACAMRSWDLLRKCPSSEPKWREALRVLQDLAQQVYPFFKNEEIFNIPREMAESSWGIRFSTQEIVDQMLQALIDDATVLLEEESKPFKYYSMNNQVEMMRKGRKVQLSFIKRVKQTLKVKMHAS